MIPKDGMSILSDINGTAVNNVRVTIIFRVEGWVIVAFEKYTNTDTYMKITSVVGLKRKARGKSREIDCR